MLDVRLIIKKGIDGDNLASVNGKDIEIDEKLVGTWALSVDMLPSLQKDLDYYAKEDDISAEVMEMIEISSFEIIYEYTYKESVYPIYED